MAINLLQLTKVAFKRCQVLSPPKDMSGSAVEILAILISYLLNEHIDYALEIGLQGIPLPGKFIQTLKIENCRVEISPVARGGGGRGW